MQRDVVEQRSHTNPWITGILLRETRNQFALPRPFLAVIGGCRLDEFANHVVWCDMLFIAARWFQQALDCALRPALGKICAQRDDTERFEKLVAFDSRPEPDEGLEGREGTDELGLVVIVFEGTVERRRLCLLYTSPSPRDRG